MCSKFQVRWLSNISPPILHFLFLLDHCACNKGATFRIRVLICMQHNCVSPSTLRILSKHDAVIFFFQFARYMSKYLLWSLLDKHTKVYLLTSAQSARQSQYSWRASLRASGYFKLALCGNVAADKDFVETSFHLPCRVRYPIIFAVKFSRESAIEMNKSLKVHS